MGVLQGRGSSRNGDRSQTGHQARQAVLHTAFLHLAGTCMVALPGSISLNCSLWNSKKIHLCKKLIFYLCQSDAPLLWFLPLPHSFSLSPMKLVVLLLLAFTGCSTSSCACWCWEVGSEVLSFMCLQWCNFLLAFLCCEHLSELLSQAATPACCSHL